MGKPAGNLRQAVLPGLIGVIGSIAVALIGVLPELRRQDRETIDAQRRKLEEIRTQFGIEQTGLDANGPWTISGKVGRLGATHEPAEFEVYLVPGNSHLARPGDDGRFSFDKVLPGSFFLIVRELGTGSNGTARALITPDDRMGSLESHGTVVQYQVNRGTARPEAAEAPPPNGARAALETAPAGTHDGGIQ